MKYKNATEALVLLASKILKEGDDVPSRNGPTKEIVDNTIVLLNPTQRCFMLPHRHDNIFANIAETLWVLSGRSDIGWLKKYLPRAADYSDDGTTWRAAYGQRLRRWEDPDSLYKIDQLLECYKILSEDPTSRRGGEGLPGREPAAYLLGLLQEGPGELVQEHGQAHHRNRREGRRI